MLKGNVDLISINKITGWAIYMTAPDNKCAISVKLNGKEVVASKADVPREDLKSLGLKTDAFAFTINVEKPFLPDDLNKIEIFATVDIKGGNLLELKLPISKNALRPVQPTRRSYQSFDEKSGDSNSFEKLKKLRLPSLEGKSVLDIGCNEGFFCYQALKQGATKVVGIDSNKDVIELAKQRVQNATFIHSSWWKLPNEKFDIILFLSAIHYERNQQKLLSYLKEHLTDNGILILECGIYQYLDNYWTMVQRHDGVFRYPSSDYLINTLLKGFVTTIMGRSVDQSGDPIPRFVFHCSTLRPTVMFVYGPSGSGKTILAKRLAKSQIPIYAIDSLFNRLIDKIHAPKTKLCEFISTNGDLFLLDKLSAQIINAGLTQELVNLIIDELPLEAEAIIVEGEILTHETFRNMLAQAIEAKGGTIWDVHRNP